MDGTVVLSAVAALVIGPRLLSRRDGEAEVKAEVKAEFEAEVASAAGGVGRRRRLGPEAAMGVVVALVFVNQFFFNAYVVRVHDGSPAFIAHYLPSGWFALARDNAVVQWLARNLPMPGLFSVTTLRVQASLELPFVLFGYLSVLRWLDSGLYRRVARSPMIWFASAAYTVVFCAIEWGLRNPDTVQDIVIRCGSAVMTPVLIHWIAGRPGGEAGLEGRGRGNPGSLPGLVIFAVSVCVLGYLVLVVYNTALLYNLGLLGPSLPHAVLALGALALLRWVAVRVPQAKVGSQGAAYVTLASSVRWMLVLFVVPALAVRYSVGFGSEDLAVAAVVVLGIVAGAGALRGGLAVPVVGRDGLPLRKAVLVVWLGVALVAGLVSAYVAVIAEPYAYYEAALPRAFGAGVLTLTVACALIDRRWPGRASVASEN